MIRGSLWLKTEIRSLDARLTTERLRTTEKTDFWEINGGAPIDDWDRFHSVSKIISVVSVVLSFSMEKMDAQFIPISDFGLRPMI